MSEIDNQTYYIAWHPEEGYDLESISTFGLVLLEADKAKGWQIRTARIVISTGIAVTH